jgi:hypothetical protein
LLLWSCSKERKVEIVPTLPATPYAYDVNYKEENDVFMLVQVHLGKGVIGSVRVTSPFNLLGIPVTSSPGPTLGRVIFYDNITSLNLSNNCTGCHNGPVVVQGTSADAPEKVLAAQSVGTLPGHAGLVGIDQMVARMIAKPYYAQLFKNAYGTTEITPDRISDALAQYITAMQGAARQGPIAGDIRFADPFR